MNRVFRYWKTVLWSVLMLIAFLLPAGNFSKAPSLPGIPEFIHIFLFAVFTCLLIYDQVIAGNLNMPKTRNYLLAIILAILFGITIEILQKLSGLGRTAELSDVMYDSAGSFLAVICIWVYFRFRRPGDSTD